MDAFHGNIYARASMSYFARGNWSSVKHLPGSGCRIPIVRLHPSLQIWFESRCDSVILPVQCTAEHSRLPRQKCSHGVKRGLPARFLQFGQDSKSRVQPNLTSSSEILKASTRHVQPHGWPLWQFVSHLLYEPMKELSGQ